MATRKSKSAVAADPTSTRLSFGGKAKSVHLPSGSKLIFDDPDQDGIIKFLGKKDISEKLSEDPGSVIYLVGHDGRRIVSFPTSYAFSEFEMEPGKYYYLHLADMVQTKPEFNKMKDFNIDELGEEGDVVPLTSDRLPGIDEITLDLPSIKKLNYEMLNYPLRKV
jgi:hypothetical protein